jgi:hypothetical protein
MRKIMDSIEQSVMMFMDLVNEKCNGLIHIEYEYQPEQDVYDIWHDNHSLDYNNKFAIYIGERIREVFFNNGIYNISFGYDYKKAKH